MADASVSERDSGYVLVRVPGSPDVLKEAPVSGFVTKNGDGNVGFGVTPTTGGYGRGVQLNDAGDGCVNTLWSQAINTDDRRFSLANNAYNGGVSLWKYSRTGASAALYETTAGCHRFFTAAVGTAGANITWVERLQIEQSGHVLAGADNSQTLGGAAKRWSVVYAGSGAINTSDERSKTDIGEIPDAWLDAWAGVEWRRYKFIDGNRWHVGLVAQQVHAAFAAHDLDAFEIGLCCFDAWEEQREPIYEAVTKTRKASRTEQIPAGEDENGKPLYKLIEVAFDEEYEESIDTGKTRVTLEAGDRWGLRYDECQAIEAAFQRRALARMAARLAALETVGG